MKLLFSILLALSIANARAESWVDFNVAAHHWNREETHKYNYNENNYGVGYEYQENQKIFMIGFYKNSLYRNSTYGLVGLMPLHTDHVSAGAVIGYVAGYQVAPIIPAAGLLVSFNQKNVGINLIAVPTAHSLKASGFLGLQFKIKL